MEATKKVTGKSVKKWLGNNAIIVLMLAVSLIVGIIHPNFFALANIINLFKNVSIRYIIALGISGCLITTGNDLSAGRPKSMMTFNPALWLRFTRFSNSFIRSGILVAKSGSTS